MKHSIFLCCALALTPAPLSLSAATLTNVPMQGTMIMPMVRYHADNGTLSVMLDNTTVPHLTPLSVSNPGDSFAPGDPWFDSLDPSRQGLAFSRRYGFTMDTMTDLMPAGTAMWIRMLSSSPGLEAHMARVSPKTWQPIFGTGGSTNALQWDGTMFHAAFAAPPGTNTYAATFVVFLADATSGSPIAGTQSAPFTFNWTDVPDGRPALSIALQAVSDPQAASPPPLAITWPASATNYALEAADSPAAANWTLVTNAPALLGGQAGVALNAADANRFFRLRRVQ